MNARNLSSNRGPVGVTTKSLIVRSVIPSLAVCVVALAAILFTASPAASHGRSVSYSNWEIGPNGAEVSVRLKLLELSRLGPDALPPGSLSADASAGAPDLPGRSFPRELVLLADGEPCRIPPVAKRRPDEPGWVQYRWRIECPENSQTLAIRSHILLDVAPSHMHFARVRIAGGSDKVRERVLTEASPEWLIRAPVSGGSTAQVGSTFADYVKLGIGHIVSGWDHLAFVFGLLLLARRFAEVARLITGFTLAHSLTLALAVLGWVHPNAAAVEAVIAFSVALVAIEKGWILSGRNPLVPASVLTGLAGLALAGMLGVSELPLLTVVGLILFSGCYFALVARERNEWFRICLTFAFGLVHGFGFAGVLVEMALPSERLIPALLGFNVGVELGQLGVVLLLWPILVLGRRFSPIPVQAWSAEVAAASLCGLGLFWLVQRAFLV